MTLWNGLDLPSAYFQDDDVYIIHGDCLEILTLMPNNAIDLIPTSPPYNCRKSYPSGDELPWPEWYNNIRIFLQHSYRILCLGGTIAVNIPGVVRWQREHKFSSSWGDFDPTYKTHQGSKKTLGKGRVEPIGFLLFNLAWRLHGMLYCWLKNRLAGGSIWTSRGYQKSKIVLASVLTGWLLDCHSCLLGRFQQEKFQ